MSCKFIFFCNQFMCKVYMPGCKEIRGRFMMRRLVLDGGKLFIN